MSLLSISESKDNFGLCFLVQEVDILKVILKFINLLKHLRKEESKLKGNHITMKWLFVAQLSDKLVPLLDKLHTMHANHP